MPGHTSTEAGPPPVASGACPAESGVVVSLGGTFPNLKGNPTPVNATVTVGEQFWVDAYQGDGDYSNFPVEQSPSVAVQRVCNLVYYDEAKHQHAATLFRAKSVGRAAISSSNTCYACFNQSVLANIQVVNRVPASHMSSPQSGAVQTA